MSYFRIYCNIVLMNSSNKFISICIPAYKRIGFLRRLLQSIESQTYKDFEVIVSDDSDDDSVFNLVQEFLSKFSISYFKNTPALGTPTNWNFGISKARGEWIKLMHDDDWFATTTSLEEFAIAARRANKFVFSAYANCMENTNNSNNMFASEFARKRIVKAPVTLLAENIIGPPSVAMLHKSITEQYDERMKWRVDLDFYIRVLLQEKSFNYIDKVLVNVGVSESQVTNFCINIPSVELPEGYLLLEKYGTRPLRNIMVFDAWWRIIRNLDIRQKSQLEQFGETHWPRVILSMVSLQSFIPAKLLRVGILSKFVMCCNYCINLIQSNI
jgi:glycosyltransferase involved in cell wall biosynthesis